MPKGGKLHCCLMRKEKRAIASMPVQLETSKAETLKPDVVTHKAPITNIFTPIKREKGIVESYTQKVLPHTTLNGKRISFLISPDHTWYTHPSKFRVYVAFKVLKRDGSAIPATAKVAPVNIPPAALFKSIGLKVGDLAAGGCDPHHLAYKTYLEWISSFDFGARATHLALSGYFEDRPGHFNSCETDSKKTDFNPGFFNRWNLVKGSKRAEFIFPLNLDVFSVDGFFPPGMKMNLDFELNDPKWFLMSSEASLEYKIEIQEMYLLIEKVRLDPSIMAQHEAAFARGGIARYPYRRNVIKKMTLASTQKVFYWQNVFNGVLPSQVFVVFNDVDADFGSYKSNPFNFKHFDVTKISLTHDGREIQTFNVDFDDNKYIEMVYAFYENIGLINQNGGCDVEPDAFRRGYTIASWSLIPDKRQAFGENFGGLDLYLEFKAATTC